MSQNHGSSLLDSRVAEEGGRSPVSPRGIRAPLVLLGGVFLFSKSVVLLSITAPFLRIVFQGGWGKVFKIRGEIRDVRL